ncbi:hypothetical protein [Aerosakkonema funiforme]|uniref:hypothetical protein n=1 Tax=Aerosakkonema funiforme TaxID=1246630 RepID=UPI0035BAF640
MNIIEILKEDYQRFPADRAYSIYAEDTLLPWRPRIAIFGWSELKLNTDGLIARFGLLRRNAGCLAISARMFVAASTALISCAVFQIPRLRSR